MLSRAERIVLELLEGECRWWYGLELVQASGGRLKRGTIYVSLNRLEDAGLVESRTETDEEFRQRTGSGFRRHLYRITQDGLRVRERWGDTSPKSSPAFAGA